MTTALIVVFASLVIVVAAIRVARARDTLRRILGERRDREEDR